MRHRFQLLLPLLSCCALACAADPEAGAPKGAAQGAHCAPQNLTQPCSCGALRGSQTCSAAGWNACECRAPSMTSPGSRAMGGAGAPGNTTNDPLTGDPTNAAGEDPAGDRSRVRLDRVRTVPIGGSCAAGHLEGTCTVWHGP